MFLHEILNNVAFKCLPPISMGKFGVRVFNKSINMLSSSYFSKALTITLVLWKLMER